MINQKRAFEVNKHGLSLHDDTYIISGIVPPDALSGAETYPAGTVYLRTNGTAYQKQLDGSWLLFEAGTVDLSYYYTKLEVDALFDAVDNCYDGGYPFSIYTVEQNVDGGYTLDDVLNSIDFGA